MVRKNADRDSWDTNREEAAAIYQPVRQVWPLQENNHLETWGLSDLRRFLDADAEGA